LLGEDIYILKKGKT